MSLGNKSQPEKGKLEFEGIKWESINNPNVREIIERIQLVSERMLFHWKSFPINLPPSIVDNKLICMKDLFVLPTFDELDAITTDCKGNPKFLVHNQLQSIKRKGQFTVPSINFPGQIHVWKLNSIFQKGIETAREEYLDGIAFALRFVVIYGPRLMIAEKLSVKHSFLCLGKYMKEFIDLIFGIGKVFVPNLERRIQEERCKFIVAELKCKGGGAKEVGRYVRNQSSKAMREKVTMAMQRPPPIPYRFTTPVSLDVDLRLFDRDIFRKVVPALNRILEKSSRGWFLSFREKVILELRSRKMTENEIEMEANVMVMDEFLKRIYNDVRTCLDIQAVGPDIDRLLIEQAHFNVLLHRSVDNVSLKMESFLRDMKKCFVGNYPILSRDMTWTRIKMEEFQAKYCNENKWLAHEIALELSAEQHFLKQHAYFLARDLAFLRDTEPVLRKELEADKVPCRTFEWKRLIWRPENYVITRALHGQEETIPTVVSRVPTTITNPRTDSYHPIFSLKRVTSRSTTTRWPLWRISNFIFRTFIWMLNAMYFLGYYIPFCSPLSVRAVGLSNPFIAELELSQVNGTLCPNKSSQTHTLVSRLTTIWRHVSKARTRFETQHDTGFIGKGWGRFLNRLWNIGIKGFLASLALVLTFPLLSLSVCLLSLFLAITVPFWIPLVVFVFHLICVVFYDFDCPVKERTRFGSIFVILGRIILHGFAEWVVCIFGALLVCPILSTFIVLWTIINYGIRLGWDSVVFYLLIKPKGRLPSGNSWIVKRILGPGLAPEFYFEISVEQALVAFQCRLEMEELTIFYQKTNQMITQPQVEFKNFFGACLSVFSGKLVETEGPYRDLIRETQVMRSILEDRIAKRRRELETGLNVATRSRIRMRKSQLERTLMGAYKLAQSFYPDKIFSRMSSTEEVNNFWEARGLESLDWTNLATLLLCEVFCQDFLTPLEDMDVSFTLETSMKGNPLPTDILVNNIGDDFWTEDIPVTMSKVKYQIHSPFLDISAFNPVIRSPQLVEDNISSHFSIPLPILHPAYISVIIHNRETEHPCSMDHPICQAILKALQDSGPMLNQDCISLDIEGSQSSTDDDELRRLTPTREDIVGYSTPPLFPLGDGQNHVQGNLNGSQSHRHTPTALPTPIGRRSAQGHSSKASLASPEEINLDDVVLSAFGTSV